MDFFEGKNDVKICILERYVLKMKKTKNVDLMNKGIETKFLISNQMLWAS